MTTINRQGANAPGGGLTMAARLGVVLHYLFCILAGFVGLVLYTFLSPQSWGGFVVVAVPMLAVWGIGRACLYVLAGR